MNRAYVGGIEVRREDTKLREQIEAGGSWQYVSFVKRIVWIRRTESNLVIRHKGHVLEKIQTTNDFYGFGTSPELDRAVATAKALEIDRESAPLSVDIDMMVFDSPYLEDPSDEARTKNADHRYKKHVFDLPHGNQWRLVGTDPPARLERVIVHPWQTVWSTATNGYDINPEGFLDLIAEWRREAASIADTVHKA